jgi:hypothetical protein
LLARNPDGDEQLIQVCADLDATGARDREVCGLAAAAREHPRATLHLVALTGASVPPLPHGICCTLSRVAFANGIVN